MMFYLVVMFCSVLTRQCNAVNMPGPAYASYEQCRVDGVKNAGNNQVETQVKDWVCLQRTPT